MLLMASFSAFFFWNISGKNLPTVSIGRSARRWYVRTCTPFGQSSCAKLCAMDRRAAMPWAWASCPVTSQRCRSPIENQGPTAPRHHPWGDCPSRGPSAQRPSRHALKAFGEVSAGVCDPYWRQGYTHTDISPISALISSTNPVMSSSCVASHKKPCARLPTGWSARSRRGRADRSAYWACHEALLCERAPTFAPTPRPAPMMSAT